jgi:hypothetical protein
MVARAQCVLLLAAAATLVVGCAGFQAPIDPDDYPHPPPGLRIAVTSVCMGVRYVAAARVLNVNLRRVGYTGDYVVIVDSSISRSQRKMMDHEGIVVKTIADIQEDIDGEWSNVSSRGDFRYNKIMIWGLIGYDRVLYLDLDVVVLESLNVWFHCPTEICVTHDTVSVLAANTGVISFVPSVERLRSMAASVSRIWSYDDADQGFMNHFYGFNDTLFLARNSHVSGASYVRIDLGNGKGMRYLGRPIIFHVTLPKTWHYSIGETPFYTKLWREYRTELEDGGFDDEIVHAMVHNSAVGAGLLLGCAALLVVHDLWLFRLVGPRPFRLSGLFLAVFFLIFSLILRTYIVFSAAFFREYVVRLHTAGAFLCALLLWTVFVARRDRILFCTEWWLLVLLAVSLNAVPVPEVSLGPPLHSSMRMVLGDIIGFQTLFSLEAIFFFSSVIIGAVALIIASTARDGDPLLDRPGGSWNMGIITVVTHGCCACFRPRPTRARMQHSRSAVGVNYHRVPAL